MEKIPIVGIKLSDELVQVNLLNFSEPEDIRFDLPRFLAANRINMKFLSVTCLEGRVQTMCCVAAEHERQVKALVDSKPALKGRVEILPSVGLISLFPHQSSLKVLGLALMAISKADLPLYGMASSLSALTFITSYAGLKEALAYFKHYLDLPSDIEDS